MGFLKQFCKDLDNFGQRIEFKINGKSTHTTMIGGFASVFVNLFLFAYFVQHAITMLTFDGDNRSSSGNGLSLSDERSILYN